MFFVRVSLIYYQFLSLYSIYLVIQIDYKNRTIRSELNEKDPLYKTKRI